MKKPNILITGAAGFIGTHLIKKLEGYSVQICDPRMVGNIFDDDFEDKVKYADVVYHLAALTSVEQSFNDGDRVFSTNVLGTAKVAYLCAKHNKKLIYPSSAAIYHKDLSPYAYSKYLAEEIVKGIMQSTDVVILRLFNVFGANMTKESGSIMYQFLNNEKLEVYGDGEQTRDFVHVQDVVGVMEDALKKKWNGKIVDIGTGENYTINYVAGLFAFFRGMKILYKKAPKREIKWSIADTQMLKFLYKKKMTTDLERNIEQLCIAQ